MTDGMYMCSICHEKFGPKDLDDPKYEEGHDGMMVILRFTLTNNTFLCPKCAKKVDEMIERYRETLNDTVVKE